MVRIPSRGSAAAGTPCTPGAADLCIDDVPGDRRFRINVDWSTVQSGGLDGSGFALPTSGIGIVRGGLFWFFQEENPEMLVKVLDGCGVNGHHWFFSAAGTNVGLNVVVTDTKTGAIRTYVNPDLNPAPPVQDVEAFPCN